jgi:hypothetical protein
VSSSDEEGGGDVGFEEGGVGGVVRVEVGGMER